MGRTYVRDDIGRFASTGGSGGGSSAGKSKAKASSGKRAALEKRIARQETFLKRARPGRYTASELKIERQELQKLKSQLAGVKSTTRSRK